jgi:hypothetical protein
MPAYASTAKEREIVERAVGFGLPHKHICELIVSERTGKPIDLDTLANGTLSGARRRPSRGKT